MKSSPLGGGDAVRAGDVCGDDWSRAAGAEAVRARVVAGLKEMVVALVEVGDFEGAQRVAHCLRDTLVQPETKGHQSSLDGVEDSWSDR